MADVRSDYFGTSNQYIQYDFHVIDGAQDIVNNTTQVTVQVWCWRTWSGTTDGNGTCYANINGTQYSFSWSYGDGHSIVYGSDTKLLDVTVTVPHNADGTKDLYTEVKIEHSRFSSNWNGMTVTLPTIPRAASLTGVYPFNESGTNPRITYNNPAGNSVTYLQAALTLADESQVMANYRDISKTGNDYTFPLTSTEINTLRANCTTSTALTVYVRLRCYLGNQWYYSVAPVQMYVLYADPTLTGWAYRDNNSTTTAITTNNQYIIKGKSTLAIYLSGVWGQKYASISSITANIGGTVKNFTYNGSTGEASLSWGALTNVSSNTTCTVKVTDSRGLSKSQSFTIYVYDYYNPAASCSATRELNYYATTTIKLTNASYASLGNHNTITTNWKYRTASASSWTNGGNGNPGINTTISFDINTAYYVLFTISDRLTTITYTVFVDVGTPVLYIDGKQRRIGVNCFPTVALQVSGVCKATSFDPASSRKIKTNIEPIPMEEAEKVLQLEAVSFDFIHPDWGIDKRGFIAEDVAEVLPNLVIPEEEDAPAGLDYMGIIPYLQMIIKNQEERIKALEDRLNGTD